ncbi:MAG: hypothetical protein KAV87_55495 [Desulfobacteraceae bacterium]|nr:hypothetical protein [Desulfobacteraceae bacterium]
MTVDCRNLDYFLLFVVFGASVTLLNALMWMMDGYSDRRWLIAGDQGKHAFWRMRLNLVIGGIFTIAALIRGW